MSFLEDIRDQDQIAPLGAVWSGLTRDKLVRWPILHTVWVLIRQLPKEQSFEYIRNKQTTSFLCKTVISIGGKGPLSWFGTC